MGWGEGHNSIYNMKLFFLHASRGRALRLLTTNPGSLILLCSSASEKQGMRGTQSLQILTQQSYCESLVVITHLLLYVILKSVVSLRLPGHPIHSFGECYLYKILFNCDISFMQILYFHNVHPPYGLAQLLFHFIFPEIAPSIFVISTFTQDSHMRTKYAMLVFVCLAFPLSLMISCSINSPEYKMNSLFFVHE